MQESEQEAFVAAAQWQACGSAWSEMNFALPRTNS